MVADKQKPPQYAYIHTYIPMYVCIYMYMYIYIYIHIYIHTRIHTHTHTHTHIIENIIYIYIHSIYILPLPPLQNEPLPDLRTRKEEAVRRRLERLEKGGGPSSKGCSVVHELQRVAEMGLEHVGFAS